jgi:hypothetical protein
MGIVNMLRGKVPFKGKFVKVDNIPAGEPIMLSAKEWQKRNRKVTYRNLLLYWVGFPAVVFPIWIALDVFLPGDLGLGSLFIASIYAFMFPAMMTITMLINSWVRRSKRRYTSLSENGMIIWMDEMLIPVFIPYGLIWDFHVREGRLAKSLMLTIHGFDKPQPMVGLEILRDDGLVMLRRMIGDRPRDAGEPPELHVYGDRSSRVSSVPNISDEPDGGV